MSDEFVYDEYRQKKIREKIDEQIASRVKTKVTCVAYFHGFKIQRVFISSICGMTV